MKKYLVITIFVCLLIVFVKYCFSNYDIVYNIDNYDIHTIYKNKRFYFEIKDNNITYNFDIYSKRKLNKAIIKKIKIINLDNYKCIYPVIKELDTYPLCYDINNNYLVDYNLIDDVLLDEYKTSSTIIEKPNKDFIYYNNLNSNEYIALWAYNGYIIMNDKKYNIIKLFNKDKYDNNLSYIIDDTIYMPNYNEEYEYTTLIALNLTSQKISKLKLNYKIDYDSYIVGNIKNNLYIFDNKSSVLYEINIKNGQTNIKSSNEKGYVKYENNKFIKCSKTEYKNDKIKYNINDTNYIYETNNKTYRYIKDNKKIKIKINDKEIIKVFEKDNNLFYILDDSFYIYSPIKGYNKIFYSYELSFNNSNSVFMYIK